MQPQKSGLLDCSLTSPNRTVPKEDLCNKAMCEKRQSTESHRHSKLCLEKNWELSQSTNVTCSNCYLYNLIWNSCCEPETLSKGFSKAALQTTHDYKQLFNVTGRCKVLLFSAAIGMPNIVGQRHSVTAINWASLCNIDWIMEHPY